MSDITFTAVKTFPGALFNGSRRTMTVVANGGQVSVEVMHTKVPEVWVPYAGSPITATSAVVVNFTEKDVRITPSGGAVASLLS